MPVALELLFESQFKEGALDKRRGFAFANHNKKEQVPEEVGRDGRWVQRKNRKRIEE